MTSVTTKGFLQFKGALIGMILGDGCIKNGRKCFNSTSVSLKYLEWKKEILAQLTKVTIGEQKFSAGHFGKKVLYQLSTLSHPVYQKLRMRMYNENGCRTIDPYILKILNELGILFWYLDDGCLDKNSGLKFGIHSNRYSYGDHLLFQKFLNDRFELRFNIRQSFKKERNCRYFWLYLKSVDRLKFYDTIIAPYFEKIPQDMMYKIPKREDIERLMASPCHKRFYENIV